MIKYIWNLLFYSCRHEWVKIEEIKLILNGDIKIPSGYKYILQCKKCGNIKTKRI